MTHVGEDGMLYRLFNDVEERLPSNDAIFRECCWQARNASTDAKRRRLTRNTSRRRRSTTSRMGYGAKNGWSGGGDCGEHRSTSLFPRGRSAVSPVTRDTPGKLRPARVSESAEGWKPLASVSANGGARCNRVEWGGRHYARSHLSYLLGVRCQSSEFLRLQYAVNVTSPIAGAAGHSSLPAREAGRARRVRAFWRASTISATKNRFSRFASKIGSNWNWAHPTRG